MLERPCLMENENKVQKVYEAPVVQELGNVSELTQYTVSVIVGE